MKGKTARIFLLALKDTKISGESLSIQWPDVKEDLEQVINEDILLGKF